MNSITRNLTREYISDIKYQKYEQINNIHLLPSSLHFVL